MYSEEIEPYKRALHYAIVFYDFGPMQELMPEVAQAVADALHWHNNLHDRRVTAQKIIVKTLQRLTGDNYAHSIIQSNPLYQKIRHTSRKSAQSLQSLQSLQRLETLERLERLETLERLQSLQSLQILERLRVTSQSYADIDIPDDAVVYCDPPYHASDNRLYEFTAKAFDHGAFYDWCVSVSKTNPIFISEYSIEDDRFEIVAEKEKMTSISCAKSLNVTERLYTVKK